MSLQSKNLAEPLTLSFYDAVKFCANNVCSTCLLEPHISGFENSFALNLYHIHCYKCKTDIYEGGYVSKDKVDQIKYDRAVGERQMQDDKPISKDQAIKDLGF